MSEENVEMARRGYEAFNRGDLEGMVATFAPNFEYVTTGESLTPMPSTKVRED